MAFELKDGQGTLFRNDKEDNAARPDYRGEANIDGTLYRIAGWIKEGKNGKWLSLSIALPQPKVDRDTTGKKVDVDVDGDIPF
jgi:hypothetical protein